MSALAHSDDTTMQVLDIQRAIDDQQIVMVPVKSSNIRRIGHDAGSLTLVIQFASGTYAYLGVPADIHRKLMAMDSKGAYFVRHIKGLFASVKLPSPAREPNNHAYPVATHKR